MYEHLAENGIIFQSTPPIRVATAAVELMDDDIQISIHATHTGGDESPVPIDAQHKISIHATHTGGDHYDTVGMPFEYISIHATHTGGDDSSIFF